MNYFKKNPAFLTIIFLSVCIFYFLPIKILAQSDSGTVNVGLQVINETSCVGDGICHTGEDATSCPLDCVVTAPSGGGGGYNNYPYIYGVLVNNITVNSAEISWQTLKPGNCQIYFGQTADYEQKVTMETNFDIVHSSYLQGLSPATTYHFRIFCADANNFQDNISDQQFTTLPIINNVSNFEAISGSEDIGLQWTNPADPRFAGVEILRKDDFFPLNNGDGTVIYNGQGNSFVDISLENGKTYYYTIFAYDKDGNYSSGAVVSAIPQGKSQVVTPTPPPPANPTPPATPAAPIKKVTINDFDFSSSGQMISVQNSKTIQAQNSQPLTISIDAGKIPDGVAAMTITINQNGKETSYLMQNQNNAYAISLNSPNQPGNYSFYITLLNDKNQMIQRVDAQLSIFAKVPASENNYVVISRIIYFMVLAALMIFIILFWKRRKKEEKYARVA